MSDLCPHGLPRMPRPPAGWRPPAGYVVGCWCEADATRVKPPAPGLGDVLAKGLSAVGITPARVSALLGRPCGCAERKQRLNECGRAVGRAFRRLIGRAHR